MIWLEMEVVIWFKTAKTRDECVAHALHMLSKTKLAIVTRTQMILHLEGPKPIQKDCDGNIKHNWTNNGMNRPVSSDIF